jgi:hypothetical protein
MKFPGYVPAPAQKKILEMLDGGDESNWPEGLQGALAKSEEKLAEITNDIKAASQINDIESIDELYRWQNNAAQERDLYQRQVDCLYRLAQDKRIKGAYSKLTIDIAEDEQWGQFIEAAVVCLIDYSEPRRNVKKSNQLAKDISECCEKLAGLLQDQFDCLGPYTHGEQLSLRHILLHTDSELNSEKWLMNRGDLFGLILPDTNSDQWKVLLDRQKTWGAAPSVSDLVKMVGKASQQHTHNKLKFTNIGIHSRKTNERFDYLRNFAYLLFTVRKYPITPNIKHAMATTASVAFEQPTDFSYSDVDQAIKSVSSYLKEHSIEK